MLNVLDTDHIVPCSLPSQGMCICPRLVPSFHILPKYSLPIGCTATYMPDVDLVCCTVGCCNSGSITAMLLVYYTTVVHNYYSVELVILAT